MANFTSDYCIEITLSYFVYLSQTRRHVSHKSFFLILLVNPNLL